MPPLQYQHRRYLKHSQSVYMLSTCRTISNKAVLVQLYVSNKIHSLSKLSSPLFTC